MSLLAPKASHRLLDGRGDTDAAWYRWFGDVTQIANNAVTRDILAQAIADALGEITGVTINGSSTISVTGSSVDGYNINLRELADSGVGAGLYKITRDRYGRVSGTEQATASDVPFDNVASGLDAEDVQDALDELAAEKIDDAPSDGTPYVRQDGAWISESTGGGGLDLRNSTEFFDDFDGKPPTTTVVEAGTDSHWIAQGVSGGAGSITSIDAGTAREGVWQFGTGTGSTSVAALTRGNVNNVRLGGGERELEVTLSIPTLSNGTDRFAMVMGWRDVWAGSATARMEIVQADNLNSGVFFLRCLHSGVTTDAVGTTAPTAGTYYRLKMIVNAAGTEATLYVNDTLEATLTTTLPTAAMSAGFQLAKSVGTNPRTVNLDWFRIKRSFATPR